MKTVSVPGATIRYQCHYVTEERNDLISYTIFQLE